VKKRKTVTALVALVAVAVAAIAATAVSARPAGQITVGLISDVGRFNDKSFNQAALEGFKRAQKEFGVKIRPVESRAASDYLPNLATCVRARSAVCVSVGFLLADATNTVAKKFPKTQFAIVDYSVKAPPFKTNRNVTGITFATNENSYLIGCLSALMAKKAGGDTISAVGGIKLPTVDIFIAGYQAGASKCVPGTKTLVGYSQDFIAQDKCKEVALGQIGQGSKVVFQVAGGCGLGALDAAKEAGIWGIGVDRDQSFLGKHIMTSAVKRVDVSTFLTVKREVEGKRLGGFDLNFNLKNSGVAVGKISPEVPLAYINIMKKLQADIIAGKIKPPKTL
jgi:basic membrane protein A